MNTLQNSLIEQAIEKHGIIFPINGKSFQENHFTQHTDKNSVEWIWFWYSDADNSSHIVIQQVNCPQCEGELVDNHCACEMRGI